VVEVGNRVLLRLEDLRTLFKEVVLWEQNLPLVVRGVGEVIALLDDGENRVDGHPIATTTQCLRNVMA